MKAPDSKPFNNRVHLVHPIDMTVGLFDVRGEAICPICRSRWRRLTNEVVLVE